MVPRLKCRSQIQILFRSKSKSWGRNRIIFALLWHVNRQRWFDSFHFESDHWARQCALLRLSYSFPNQMQWDLRCRPAFDRSARTSLPLRCLGPASNFSRRSTALEASWNLRRGLWRSAVAVLHPDKQCRHHPESLLQQTLLSIPLGPNCAFRESVGYRKLYFQSGYLLPHPDPNLQLPNPFCLGMQAIPWA